MMTNLKTILTTFLGLAFAVSASANPIKIVALTGGDHPVALGDNDEYVMMPYSTPNDGVFNCAESYWGADACFVDGDDNNANGAYGSSLSLLADDPSWWQYDGVSNPIDHGNIFVVDPDRHLVDIILPANTRAFSLFVGANMRGSAWIEAFDDQHNTSGREYFGLGFDNTRGYGVYATGCNALTRITVEPFEWGFGHFSSYEGECGGASVPEPAPIALLALGLLGLALSRNLNTAKPTAI